MIYQLGPWQFNTELNLLYCEHSEKELDPLTVKLLTYFINHPKAIISRQQLIEDVWRQSYVDDNAINRAMSELRKHLQHSSLDEPLIKTHYRLGYSLILAAKALDINQTTPVLPSQKKASAKKRLLILCSSVVVLALTLSVYWYTQPQETTVLTPDFELDVIENDDTNTEEMWPLISYNKDYLASTRRYHDNQGIPKIAVRRLSDNKEIILAHPKFTKVVALSWQNQQDKLLARAFNLVSNKCEYVLFDITDFDGPIKHTTIKPCNNKTDWAATLDKKGRFFYYMFKDTKGRSNALLRFDVKSKEVITLIPARTGTYGPQRLNLSPDGKKLAYFVTDLSGRNKVFLKNLATLEVTLIHSSKYQDYKLPLDWVNNDTLRYIDRDQMLTFDTHEHKLIQRYQIPKFISPNYITHKSPTDMYFTTSDYYHTGIKHIDSFNEPDKIFSLFESKQSSPFVQYDDVYQHYYFVSYRSGQEQIWLSNQNGLKQLSDFKNQDTEIRFFKISPDGKRLIYYRDKQYSILNTRTGEIKNAKMKGFRSTQRIWGPDSNSVIYFDNRENYQVKKYDFTTQQHSIVATLKAIRLFSSNKGIPFAATKQGIVDLSTEKVHPLPENFTLTSSSKFAQVGKYFYAIEGLDTSLLYRWQTNDQTADITDVKSGIAKFVVTDKHEILIVSRKRRNVKIERLSWQPLESSN